MSPLVSDAGYDVFGARTQWPKTYATTQFANGPTRWEGFAYHVRHHLLRSSVAYNVALPVPAVGTHTAASNATVEYVSATLGALGTAGEREEAISEARHASGACVYFRQLRRAVSRFSASREKATNKK
ncbi:MAG: hypothetical protein R3E66_01115 [bacterium]